MTPREVTRWLVLPPALPSDYRDLWETEAVLICAFWLTIDMEIFRNHGSSRLEIKNNVNVVKELFMYVLIVDK